MDPTKLQKKIITETEKYVKGFFENEGSGHDWWHIHRVRNLAVEINKSEGGNPFLVEMAALLHDLDDWKLKKDQKDSRTKEWLDEIKMEKSLANQIVQITQEVSFKGANVENKTTSLEAKIVQDADRLDAMGAIGIARAFAYGGSKGRLIYHPGIKTKMHSSFEEYKNSDSPTVNHFYEKLLLLKDRLNTKTAIQVGEKRHRYMQDYISKFFAEWNGKI